MTETENNQGDKSGGGAIGLIVSSSHLAEGAVPALSETEFALTLAGNAFQRWIVRCMAAAGEGDLGALDILVLHVTNHRARAKKLADLCLMLNIEDTHTVTYALKKLEKRGLVKSARAGKEKVVEITPKGEAACTRYRDVREVCLVSSVAGAGLDTAQLSEIASLMRTLAGQYDQAARAAASL